MLNSFNMSEQLLHFESVNLSFEGYVSVVVGGTWGLCSLHCHLRHKSSNKEGCCDQVFLKCFFGNARAVYYVRLSTLHSLCMKQFYKGHNVTAGPTYWWPYFFGVVPHKSCERESSPSPPILSTKEGWESSPIPVLLSTNEMNVNWTIWRRSLFQSNWCHLLNLQPSHISGINAAWLQMQTCFFFLLVVHRDDFFIRIWATDIGRNKLPALKMAAYDAVRVEPNSITILAHSVHSLDLLCLCAGRRSAFRAIWNRRVMNILLVPHINLPPRYYAIAYFKQNS